MANFKFTIKSLWNTTTCMFKVLLDCATIWWVDNKDVTAQVWRPPSSTHWGWVFNWILLVKENHQNFKGGGSWWIISVKWNKYQSNNFKPSEPICVDVSIIACLGGKESCCHAANLRVKDLNLQTVLEFELWMSCQVCLHLPNDKGAKNACGGVRRLEKRWCESYRCVCMCAK